MSDQSNATNGEAKSIPSASLDELFLAAERDKGAVALPQAVSEGITQPDSSHDGPPVAASQPMPTPVNTKTKPCNHTDSPDYKTCPLCLWPFCALCASVMDPSYCHLCLNTYDAELVASPLVDEDGVTREGRVLTPGPHFGSFAKGVSQMNVGELERHVEQFKALVKQAEVALDQRRVKLGTLQMELTQQKEQQRRHLRAVKVAGGARKISVADPTKPSAAKPAFSMAALVEAMKAITKARADKAAASRQQPNTTQTTVQQQPKQTETKS